MDKLDLNNLGKLKPHPIFKGLSDDLKDPKAFKKLETKLKRVVYSDHEHKTVKKYVACERCKAKFDKRQAMIKEAGFKSTEQYLEWKKVMMIITNERDFQLQ